MKVKRTVKKKFVKTKSKYSKKHLKNSKKHMKKHMKKSKKHLKGGADNDSRLASGEAKLDEETKAITEARYKAEGILEKESAVRQDNGVPPEHRLAGRFGEAVLAPRDIVPVTPKKPVFNSSSGSGPKTML